jgi:hypothetical protein
MAIRRKYDSATGPDNKIFANQAQPHLKESRLSQSKYGDGANFFFP